MPVAVPQLYQYSHVSETKEDLDWADRKLMLRCQECWLIRSSCQYRLVQIWHT